MHTHKSYTSLRPIKFYKMLTKLVIIYIYVAVSFHFYVHLRAMSRRKAMFPSVYLGAGDIAVAIAVAAEFTLHGASEFFITSFKISMYSIGKESNAPFFLDVRRLHLYIFLLYLRVISNLFASFLCLPKWMAGERKRTAFLFYLYRLLIAFSYCRVVFISLLRHFVTKAGGPRKTDF